MLADRGELLILSVLAAALAGGLALCVLSWNGRVSANRSLEAVVERIGASTPHDSPGKGLPLIDPDKRPGRVLDINRATLEELDSLPGLGKTLAQRIIEFRSQRGGIKTLEELGSIEGISPKKLVQLSQQLTTIATEATGAPPPKILNLNLASQAELDALPGIGPTLAAAILETRRQKGGFRSLDDLQDVPGLGEATFLKFADLVDVK